MKNTLICIILLITLFSNAQEIKVLTPTSIEVLDLNTTDEKEFNRNRKACEAIWERMSKGLKLEDLTQEEKAELDKMVDETMTNYWDIEGQGCSWYCGGGPFKETASSHLADQGSIQSGAENAMDLNYKNAWVEGVPGYGIGEYLEYSFYQGSPRITEIIVVNGYVKSETAWRNNSRVKKLKVYIKDEPYAILNLTDQRAAQHFKVDPIGKLDKSIDYITSKSLPPWTMKFEIMEVYPGDKYEDTVLSEIYFDGIDVHCFAKGTLITMADHTQKPIEELLLGEQVLSYDQATDSYITATIKELANPMHDALITLSLSDSSTITCTRDHPLLSSSGDWLSYTPEQTQIAYRFDDVKQLEIGSIIHTVSGAMKILNIKEIDTAQQTYTIVKLDNANTFIANGIVVGTEELRVFRTCDTHKLITE
ncbi:hypothetical protein ATO12_02875 [Aquimarina atlantica]|uniref:Hint domain-containing protein n=1 Tax=Aquimarina atlantica TaxID=1317122 RepID=A0A023C0G3_9FLAO|nr:hypothetical protein [Aquimarina atlantica]EZH75750.1 hypothetical protein ATO12_02875 [Aquimarina atlantica]